MLPWASEGGAAKTLGLRRQVQLRAGWALRCRPAVPLNGATAACTRRCNKTQAPPPDAGAASLRRARRKGTHSARPSAEQ